MIVALPPCRMQAERRGLWPQRTTRPRQDGRKARAGTNLEPANEAHETIHVNPAEQDFRCGGKVIGIHRVL